MAKQNNLVPINVKNFVGGIITDGNPLTFPDNASLSERNMVLNIDGTRSRRFGMSFEEDYQVIEATGLKVPKSGIEFSTFKWDNVAGDASKVFIVVGVANKVFVFDSSVEPLSAGLIHTEELSEVSNRISFASVDGILVMACSNPEVYFLRYELETKTVIGGKFNLQIRDTFGVEDITSSGKNLRSGSNIELRLKTLTQAHCYNLRNQTWAVPRLRGEPFEEVRSDPIASFVKYSGGQYPSNSDSVLDGLYPNTNSPIDPITNRFNSKDVISNVTGFPAPIGYFVIDALDRGGSRKSEIDKLYSRYNGLINKPKSFKNDKTPGGASVIAQYAGRIFYSGFSSVVEGGDSCSPNMGSMVLFSQLVQTYNELGLCYQKGNPCSKEDSDLLATDGGFIKIDGAYNIHSLIPLSKGLIVIADNGVWVISGEDRGQFKATSLSSGKITSTGCPYHSSIVNYGDSIAFWSRDGIYNIAPNKYGDLVCENISDGKISKLVGERTDEELNDMYGIYDSYDNSIKWLFGKGITSTESHYEIVYSLDFSGFLVNEIKKPTSSTLPVPVCSVVAPAYSAREADNEVVAGADIALVGTDQVIVRGEKVTNSVKELLYVTILGQEANNISFTFSKYSDPTFKDWVGYLDGDGIDSGAYILTGWVGGGDFLRRKGVVFLHIHFYKTEDGFELDEVTGDYIPTNQSSCLLQAQWNWSNNPNSGKWTFPRQAYRLGKQWRPEDVGDDFDNGFYTVETRNKIRGSGKVVSFLFSAEEGKDMRIIGWDIVAEVAGSV